MLEEPLQSAVGRSDQNPSPCFGGDVAEVDGARPDHADNEHAERLQPTLAEPNMASQRPGEGGDGLATWAILATESSSTIDPAVLTSPVRVAWHPWTQRQSLSVTTAKPRSENKVTPPRGALPPRCLREPRRVSRRLFGWILRCDRHLLKLGVEAGFGFGGRHVSDGFEQAAVVEPIDPLQGGELHGLEAAPRPASADDFGLVEAVDRLGERVEAPIFVKWSRARAAVRRDGDRFPGRCTV